MCRPEWAPQHKHRRGPTGKIPFSLWAYPPLFIINEELIFGGLIFLNLAFLRRIASYLREARVLAIDGTFGVIPRVPADAEQLITIHAVLDNVVRDLLT